MIIESIIKKYGVSLDDIITDPNKTTLLEAMWRLYEYSNVLASLPLKDVVREVAVYLFTYKYDGNGLLEFQNFLKQRRSFKKISERIEQGV